MPQKTPFSGSRIAVLGAGLSGRSAASLAMRAGASEVFVLDQAPGEKLAPARSELERIGAQAFFGPAALESVPVVDLVVQSPGIDLASPLAQVFSQGGVPIYGEIEFAWQHSDLPMIAITGTNGKTTTTELASAMLRSVGKRCPCAGNYGVPLSEVVMEDDPPWDVISLEVSSFQLEAIHEFRPDVAVWLNFAPDHLDRYRTLQEYREAKQRIFEFQTSDDWAVVQAGEESALGDCPARRRTFHAFQEADYSFEKGWIHRDGHPVFDFQKTRMRGLHNAENLMAVLAALEHFGIQPEEVAPSLVDYAPPAHRCELISTFGGLDWVNDSKATNLHALESALRGRRERVVLIAGGKQKGLDFREVRELVEGTVDHAVLIGEIGEEIALAWEGAVTCTVEGELDKAVETALKVAKTGQSILFSPGTSSFDQFSGYGARGDAFKRAVLALGGE
ncbi:MAG: UDP-N-acetylmuramoyl-L-alanine--D-glutamate ligase [Verrucomicrobiota bacterium]